MTYARANWGLARSGAGDERSVASLSHRRTALRVVVVRSVSVRLIAAAAPGEDDRSKESNQASAHVERRTRQRYLSMRRAARPVRRAASQTRITTDGGDPVARLAQARRRCASTRPWQEMQSVSRFHAASGPPSALGMRWCAVRRLVSPHRSHWPAAAVTARATRRQFAVWYGDAAEHVRQRLERVSLPQSMQGFIGITATRGLERVPAGSRRGPRPS